MFFNGKKKLKEIRNNWTKPIIKFRNFDFISYLHQIKKQQNNTELVDDKTWKDLNLDDVFTIIDRNSSPIGQQYLYHLLHKYENDSVLLNERIKLAVYFKKNAKIRESIQLELNKLDKNKTYFIAPLIYGELPQKPRYYFLFFILSFLALISFILTIFNNSFLFLTIAIFIINLLINHFYSKNIHQYFEGFSGLNRLLISARNISKLDNSLITQLIFLNKKLPLIKKLNKRIGSLVLDIASTNEIFAMIAEYINIYFLYDLLKYCTSVGLLQKHQENIHEIFENIAQLDVAISLASYLSTLPEYCTPNFTKLKSISFEDVYHPLIPNAVSNSLKELKNSVLITGSNMAGKTTFIKTIGINLILAQTLNFCLSKSATIPQLIVKSAIKREEDLENSKSYFFVEIEELQNFIKLSNSNYLFLIDEIFRGTNTVERLAASTAVLEYLDKNNFVFVTTHDIELQELLNNKYKMFHFSEQVEGNNFYFDYQLRKGPTSSGNAIRLLEIKGYPLSIINKSMLIVKKTYRHGQIHGGKNKND